MGGIGLKRSSRIAVVTNICLAGLLLIVGIVCFYPLGISTVSHRSESIYYEGDRKSHYISLMFHVYDGEDNISQILEILDDYGLKATFFIGGSWADDYAGILRKIVRGGHELGNCGYFCLDPGKLSYERNQEEIRLCGELVRRLTGTAMTLFSSPYSHYPDELIKAAELLEYKVIQWSKDATSTVRENRDATFIFEQATNGVCGGELILLHPTQDTVKALPAILQNYLENDLEPVPVSVNIAGIVQERNS